MRSRFLFYGTFTAVGVYFAEACSFSAPPALLNPVMYLAYGLLYVLFLQVLVRWREDRFCWWYLFGMLIGLITETYITKVTFFGTAGDESRVWGLCPGACLFIIGFFHAFFSFMLGAYVSARLLQMPLPITITPHRDKIMIAASLYYPPFVLLVTATRHWDPLAAGIQYVLSTAVLVLWVVVLKRSRQRFDVLLTPRETRAVLAATVAFLSVMYFVFVSPEHGIRFAPLMPLLAVSLFTASLLGLLLWTARAGKEPPERVEFDPAHVSLRPLLAYVGWQSTLILAPLLLLSGNPAAMAVNPHLAQVMAVASALTAAVVLPWSIFKVAQPAIKRGPSLPARASTISQQYEQYP